MIEIPSIESPIRNLELISQLDTTKIEGLKHPTEVLIEDEVKTLEMKIAGKPFHLRIDDMNLSDLNKFNVRELKSMCREKRLKVGGTRADLLQRLSNEINH